MIGYKAACARTWRTLNSTMRSRVVDMSAEGPSEDFLIAKTDAVTTAKCARYNTNLPTCSSRWYHNFHAVNQTAIRRAVDVTQAEYHLFMVLVLRNGTYENMIMAAAAHAMWASVRRRPDCHMDVC